MSNYINKIISVINESETKGQLKKLDEVTGLSGEKLLAFLQRAVSNIPIDQKKCYLEVGVYQGLTLTSVAAVSKLNCYGIDNFSKYDLNNENQSIVRERLDKHTSNKAHLINLDFEEALLTLDQYIQGEKVAVYFIDGPHDYRSQYLCLDFAIPHLAKESVIIIDDANYEHVRQSTVDWLKANQDFALLFEAYTQTHPKNSKKVERKARKGWWDGVNIIVRDVEHRLPRTYPIVREDKEKFYNDHEIHSARYSELVPPFLSLLSYIPPAWVTIVSKIVRKESFIDRDYKSRFRYMNTYSESLPEKRIVLPIDE